jgi:catechol 2,3-dioxygenase-like lactoylglutathione lyase family enzyme
MEIPVNTSAIWGLSDGSQRIAHVEVTVTDFEQCVAFYRRLLPFMGLRHVVYDNHEYFYCIDGRTGFALRRAAEQYRGLHFDQTRPGLHHVCFRALP